MGGRRRVQGHQRMRVVPRKTAFHVASSLLDEVFLLAGRGQKQVLQKYEIPAWSKKKHRPLEVADTLSVVPLNLPCVPPREVTATQLVMQVRIKTIKIEKCSPGHLSLFQRTPGEGVLSLAGNC